MSGVPAARGQRRSTVRTRTAIACAGLFLVLGGTLIAATYFGFIDHFTTLETSLPSPSSPAAIRGTMDCVATGPVRVSGTTIRGTMECPASPVLLAREQAGALRRGFLVYSLIGLGVGTALAGVLGWTISRRILRPLRAVTAMARTASQENLGERLDLTGPPDELKELADTFDTMLARLEAAFASQRRFIANASHELRTPLTEMRTLIDVTLARPAASAAQLGPVMAEIGAAVDKSEELIEALLTLARADRGPSPAEVVDLPTAVEDAIDLIGPAAAARQIRIDTALQDVQVTGDRILLERLASNLIDNAVRHNVTGGWVLASTRTHAGIAELTVANGGERIAPDQVTGLFEPFRRLSGRTGNRPGSGLGLSIVASVAKAHGGHAEARARPDGGLDVQITLPASAHKEAPTGNASALVLR
jgi:signal transduction histidine kinase